MKSRVKRQEREREIKKFELIEKVEKNILFRAEVEGGTYIRKLIDDLGKELGVGAHMLELRRTRACIFEEDDKNYPCVNLYDFERIVDEYKDGDEKTLRKIIIPGEIVSELFPVVEIKKKYVDKVLHGSPIYYKFLKKKLKIKNKEIICIFCEEKFIGMYKNIDDKYVFAKAEFVLQPV